MSIHFLLVACPVKGKTLVKGAIVVHRVRACCQRRKKRKHKDKQRRYTNFIYRRASLVSPGSGMSSAFCLSVLARASFPKLVKALILDHFPFVHFFEQVKNDLLFCRNL